MTFKKSHRTFRSPFTEGSSVHSAGTMGGSDRYVDPQTFRDRIRSALHRSFDCPKRVARVTRRTPRAAENQLSGLNAVSGHTLVNLMAQSEEVLREVLELAGQDHLMAAHDEIKRRMERAARILSGQDDAE